MNQLLILGPVLMLVLVLSVAFVVVSSGKPSHANTFGKAPHAGRYLVAQANPSPSPQSLCISGQIYGTSTGQDDEFTDDTFVNSTIHMIQSTPYPGSSAFWSTRAIGFFDGGRRNNLGTDDAYYADPGQSFFGGYAPAVISGHTLAITATPVPAAYATAAPLVTKTPIAHWLSGLLQAPSFEYGYIEVAVKEPSANGIWPAPLWLLSPSGGATNTPPQMQEVDVNEIFGTVLPTPEPVQQTIIYRYPTAPPTPTPAPPTPTPLTLSLNVRNVVSPDPSTAYHSYGVFWKEPPSGSPTGTPGTVTFYIDRVPTGVFRATSTGVMNPIIILQIYVQGYDGGSQNAALQPYTMNLTYYRLYKYVGGSCGSSPVLPVIPTPNATPTAAATGVTIAQTGAIGIFPFDVAPTLPVAPSPGHELLAFFASNNGLTPPSGQSWAPVPVPSGQSLAPNFPIYYCIVGTSCASSTAYDFGGNGAVAVILDLAGENASVAPVAGVGYAAYTSPVATGAWIPNSGGITFNAYALFSNNARYDPSNINETLPIGQVDASVTSSINAIVQGSTQSLIINQMTTEAYSAGNPFQSSLNFSYTVPTTPPPLAIVGNGATITVLPAGKTPAPIPSPSPPPTPPSG